MHENETMNLGVFAWPGATTPAACLPLCWTKRWHRVKRKSGKKLDPGEISPRILSRN